MDVIDRVPRPQAGRARQRKFRNQQIECATTPTDPAGAACAILLATLPVATAQRLQDRVEIIHTRDRLLVDVYHVKGMVAPS
jgi:hypothetical protein